jgi:hypothetical protein
MKDAHDARTADDAHQELPEAVVQFYTRSDTQVFHDHSVCTESDSCLMPQRDALIYPKSMRVVIATRACTS